MKTTSTTKDRNSSIEVIARLERAGKKVKATGQGKWQAQCPAHEDNKASLTITKGSGKLLLHCHAGCSYPDIVKSLGFDDTADRYNYRGKHGKTRFTITKTADKQFPVTQPDGTTNIKGVERVPYNLPELCAANNGDYVFIPEGEKDCDNLTALGLLATCNPFGAGKWRSEFNEYFNDRSVVLLGDNDKQGRKHVNQVARELYEVAKEIRIPKLPGLKDKGDISDWLQTGNTVDELIKLVQAAQPITLDEEGEIETTFALMPMSAVKDEPLVWFWDDKIPDHGISMIQGDPGVGKSFLAVDIAAHISKGKPFSDCPDIPVKQGSVLIMCGEDAPARIKERLQWAGADLDRVFVLAREEGQINKQVDIRYDLDKLQDMIKGQGVRLIIFDPITAYMGNCKANNNNEVRAALEPLNIFAADNNLTVLAINHMNKKAGEKQVYRGLGSMGFTAVCRSVWTVIWDSEDEEKKTRIMGPVKTNYSIDPSGLKYRINNNVIDFQAEKFYEDIDTVNEDAKQVKESKIEIAIDWLKERLIAGAVASQTLIEESELAGITRGTRNRAKKRLGIIVEKDSLAYGGWFWSLPDEA